MRFYQTALGDLGGIFTNAPIGPFEGKVLKLKPWLNIPAEDMCDPCQTGMR
jgi:hypothetical protein